MAEHATWLCPSELDRARYLDMDRRMRPARGLAFALIGAGVVMLSFEHGWAPLVLYAVTLAGVPLADRWTARGRRPEYALFALANGGLLAIGGAIALTGGPASPALAWLPVPVVAAAAVFTTRGVVATVLVAILVAVVATAGADPGVFAADPQWVVASLILLVSVAFYVAGLMRAEVRHRAESVLDPLTGLLNRTTLLPRFEELRQQARLTGQPVSLLLFDLDRFKTVNDTHGHDRGDAVLKDVAYELRKSLRSFELAYRLGGEELLVLLPGAALPVGVAAAERVRARLAEAKPGGVGITVSAGVGAAQGEALTWEALFEVADTRLYEAKAAGRDRVVPAPGRVGASGEPSLAVAAGG